jgi:hypothetical protein
VGHIAIRVLGWLPLDGQLTACGRAHIQCHGWRRSCDTHSRWTWIWEGKVRTQAWLSDELDLYNKNHYKYICASDSTPLNRGSTY